ncbi:MAG: hypothetical protein K9L30_06790 [Desulfobacterales bacterium]|nr:hypothetical protein [Desulfobacterales bacterium]
MDLKVLDNIKFEVNMPALMEKLHVKPDSDNANRLEALVEEASGIAKPKAVYRLGFIENRSGDDLTVNGVTLSSHILSVNLKDVNRVFAYVATCGTELETWALSLDDLLNEFWAAYIMDFALDMAIEAVCKDINEQYQPGEVGFMSPGSLEDWPLEQQKPFFEIIGDTKEFIGVELQETMLMRPTKTVSEIMFENEEGFKSCQLCPREACTSRQAPYDRSLYDKKYS